MNCANLKMKELTEKPDERYRVHVPKWGEQNIHGKQTATYWGRAFNY